MNSRLYSEIDWELLCRQKTALIEIMLTRRTNEYDTARLLDGIIALLDEMQDEAAEAGYPVVWSTDANDCAGKL